MLMGADVSKAVTDPGAYPILLDPHTGSTVPGSVIFKLDSDGDGVPDDEDAFPDDPAYWLDADEDGMPDNWELQIVNKDPNDGFENINQVQPGDDFDGDGWWNITEFEEGTDATDRNSRPSRAMPWIPLLLMDN